MTRFTVYIDESGDAGLAKIRSGDSHGASPFFVLGATVVQHETKPRAYAKLEEIRDEIGKKKWKHATDLDHPRKVYFARQLASLNVRLFPSFQIKQPSGTTQRRLIEIRRSFTTSAFSTYLSVCVSICHIPRDYTAAS